ncbi:hypothetical protein EHQ23_19755 [Leptospira bourretii]|uniref:Uncharacterized protein n=1 Tax=Leptospira bourretii TaxID=2484962 RepID=A0A4R9IGL2_9LEPT|nr:hypothetical protein [Leptospira bourretii]TGK78906.1 hypothetical protein EHQ23_19755 [Leptospira bourretii]TGK87555.1 hypothetical protein EHQ26_19840 [Leptospira bourretii]TGL40803.1 hypothetical protein EHQ45_03175 [Leptospira bourretii]
MLVRYCKIIFLSIFCVSSVGSQYRENFYKTTTTEIQKAKIRKSHEKFRRELISDLKKEGNLRPIIRRVKWKPASFTCNRKNRVFTAKVIDERQLSKCFGVKEVIETITRPTTLNLQDYGADYWYKVEDDLYIYITMVFKEEENSWEIREMFCDIDETN